MQITTACPDLIAKIPALQKLLVALSTHSWATYNFEFAAEFESPTSLRLRILRFKYVRYDGLDTDYELRLKLHFTTRNSRECIRSRVRITEHGHTLDFDHELTLATFETTPTQAYLTDSALTDALEIAYARATARDITNAIYGLWVDELECSEPYLVYLPSLDGHTPLQPRPELLARLHPSELRYPIPGTHITVPAPVVRIGFETQMQAWEHLEALYPEIPEGATVTLLRYRLSYGLGLFRVPWSAHARAANLRGCLRAYGDHKFPQAGYLVLARPLSLFESDTGAL